MKKYMLTLLAAPLVLMAAPAKAVVVLVPDPGSFAALGPSTNLSVDGNEGDQNNYALGDAVFSVHPTQVMQFFTAGDIGGASRAVLINGFNGSIDVNISGSYQLVSFLFGRFNPGSRNQPISVVTNLATYNFVLPMGSIFSGAPFTFAGFAADGTERITRVTFADNSPEGFSTNTAIAEVGLGNYAPVGGIPEPTVWAMMILGFGLVGGALRQHKARQRVSVRFG